LLKIFEAKDLEKLNIDLDLRPDQLSSKKFLELTKLMEKYG
jgi:16S rRNA A1518/A1519 N6-dimethyltransferase RsmA/KsgA/DIM1 with predicted DNA glycosylase/AP lyase activity